jgi:hypothetical protein
MQPRHSMLDCSATNTDTDTDRHTDRHTDACKRYRSPVGAISAYTQLHSRLFGEHHALINGQANMLAANLLAATMLPHHKPYAQPTYPHIRTHTCSHTRTLALAHASTRAHTPRQQPKTRPHWRMSRCCRHPLASQQPRPIGCCHRTTQPRSSRVHQQR